tara:strand:+ start:1243 stop:1497 length:255 start_codon:yes stop_codon:yes gene_type:complete
MKWVLVDKYDNIVSKAELHSGYGKDAAKMYFVGRKQIEENEFDKLWKVLSETDYDRQRELANREGKQYEWWKDEPKHPDEGFDY